jgi:hypothetical protein
MACGGRALDVAVNLSGPGRAALVHLGRWVRVSPRAVDGTSESDHRIFGKVVNQHPVNMGSTRAGPGVVEHPA